MGEFWLRRDRRIHCHSSFLRGVEVDVSGNFPSPSLNGAQRTTTQAYDEVDRLIERRYEDGAFETLAYDANSNVTSRIDPQGRETVSTFDALNRATLRTYAEDAQTTNDLTATSFVYDANNNLLTVTETYAVSGAQIDTRTYDEFDRVQTVTDRFGKMLQYGYDANGNRTQLIEPGGGSGNAVTLYAYDALNRLSSATTDAGVTTYDYLRNSLLDRITYPNGSGSQYVYDEANRVAQIDNLHDTVLISRFEYTYDRNGNRIEQVETHSGVATPETTTYEYDLADRLEAVTYPDERVSYTYDGAGNRESEVTFATADGALLSSKTLTYNSRNQVTRLEDSEDPSVAITYGYDATGNQISRALDSGGVTTFTYDVRDRMIGVAQDAAPVATYGYDAQGLRISKLVDGSEVRYLYDGQSVLNEFEPSGATLRRYAYGSDRLLSIDDVDDGKGYYLFDALGSVVDITSDVGTLLAMYQYDAWGNTRNEAGSSSNNFGFTGHEHDDETGLIYAKARFYDPELGRFLSHDPVDGDLTNPPSLHKYLYAFQNPTVFVDPDGRAPEFKDFVAFGKSFVKTAAVAATVAVVATAAVVAAPVTATVAVGAVVVGLAADASVDRFSQALDDDPNASFIASAKLGAADTLGFTAVAESIAGVEVGSGRRLNGEERAGRLGSVAGGLVGGIAGARAGSAVVRAGDDIGRIVGDELTAGARQVVDELPVSRPRPQTTLTEESTGALGVEARGISAANKRSAPDNGQRPSQREGDLLNEARLARDRLAEEVGAPARGRPATVTAGFNSRTGEIRVGCSGGGFCAEKRVAEALGGNLDEIRFTEAVRPRPNGPPFEEVPICLTCEADFGRDVFPIDTIFRSDLE